MNEQELITSIHNDELSRGGLSHAEKVMMHSRIMAAVTPTSTHYVSPYHKHLHIAGRFVLAFGIIVCIGTTAVGGVSAQALPGDALYYFKVQVREPIIAFTKTKDSSYALERVEERYREITTLAKTKQLTPERSAEVLTYLKEQTQAVTEDTIEQKPEASSKTSVTAYLKKARNVSSTITARSQALAEVSTEAGTDTATAAIVEEVQTITEEGLKTLTTATHEVIKSIPTEDSHEEVADAVSDLQNEVETLPEVVENSDEITKPDIAISTTDEIITNTEQAPSVDFTLNEIDNLITKLNTAIEQKIIDPAPTTPLSNDSISALYLQAQEAKQKGDYQTALELLHKTLEQYETTQKSVEVQKEIANTNYKSASSSDSSIISSSTASALDASASLSL